MDRKKLVLLIVALVIAVGTALAARSLFSGAAAPQAEAAPAPQGPRVLVAKRALPVGTIITADAVGYQLWPQEMVQDAYFIDGEADMAKLLGTVVRLPITAGEPVTQGSLVAPGDRGFLAAALGAGMRAITVPVSAQTGVGGFVFPGDRVDLLLTQQVDGQDQGSALKTTETILRNIRVLATDQSTETTKTEDGKTEVRAFRTVTLEVTPRIAEKVAVAQTIGTLSLALRSIADNQTELDRAIAAGDINVPAGTSKAQEDRMLQDALNRPQEGATSFVTGGDVSRFQRRTIPRSREEMAQQVVSSMAGQVAASSAPRAPAVPTVRVTRGQAVSVEQAGETGRSLSGAVASGMNNAARVAPTGMTTLK